MFKYGVISLSCFYTFGHLKRLIYIIKHIKYYFNMFYMELRKHQEECIESIEENFLENKKGLIKMFCIYV